jgi:hypothetical protein
MYRPLRRRRRLKYFRAILCDDETLAFGVSEVMSDETSLVKRTTEMQQQGRRVHICTTNPCSDLFEVPGRERVIREAPIGYHFNASVRW